MTPAQLAALRPLLTAWNAAVARARDAYHRDPFAATTALLAGERSAAVRRTRALRADRKDQP